MAATHIAIAEWQLAALARLFLVDYEEGELDTPDGYRRRCTMLKYALEALVNEESSKHLVLADLIAEASGYKNIKNV